MENPPAERDEQGFQLESECLGLSFPVLSIETIERIFRLKTIPANIFSLFIQLSPASTSEVPLQNFGEHARHALLPVRQNKTKCGLQFLIVQT